MADKRITDLPELVQADSGDFIPIVDSSMNVTKRVAAEKVLPNGSVVAALIPDASITPSKRSGGFKIGVIEGAVLASVGNKTVTGVGFEPKLVRFTLMPTHSNAAGNFGTGAMTPTDQFASTMASSGTNSARSSSSTASFFYVSSSGATVLRFEYVSMNNDGFTINVINPNGDFRVSYEAYA